MQDHGELEWWQEWEIVFREPASVGGAMRCVGRKLGCGTLSMMVLHTTPATTQPPLRITTTTTTRLPSPSFPLSLPTSFPRSLFLFFSSPPVFASHFPREKPTLVDQCANILGQLLHAKTQTPAPPEIGADPRQRCLSFDVPGCVATVAALSNVCTQRGQIVIERTNAPKAHISARTI